MHRTEGDNATSDGLFTDGPPGTTVEERWLNAVQEEIATVVENSGLLIQQADNDTHDQLYDAINIMIPGNILDIVSSYAVTDIDNVGVIVCDTTGGDITITLPTLADNQEREIKIIHGEDGGNTNKVILDGEGAETLHGMTEIHLPKQDNHTTVVGTSVEWKIISESISCQLLLNTSAGPGVTDNKIDTFTNEIDDYGNMFTNNHGSYGTDGLEITIVKSGKYSFSYNSVTNAAMYLGLSLNSSQLTTALESITVADRLCMQVTNGSGYAAEVSWSGWLNAGDIIRPHFDGTIGAGAPQRGNFTATYIGS